MDAVVSEAGVVFRGIELRGSEEREGGRRERKEGGRI